LPLPVGTSPAQPGSGGGGRSPGLILLVAAFALVFISLQSLSEISELLLQHVDDSLLEDGTLFTAVDLREDDVDPSAHRPGDQRLLHADEEDDDDDENDDSEDEDSKQASTTNHTAALKPAAQTAMRINDHPPIVLNVGFHYFKDKFNMMRPNLSIADVEHILQDVQKTWWQGARIVLNFTNNIEEAPILLDDKRSDAYRWFVTASKDQKNPKFWKDVYHFLRKGPGKMTQTEARSVIEKYYQFSGHPLMDWLTLPVLYKTHNTVFDILTVKYWPWNNGGQLGSRIFFRSGSCDPELHVNRKAGSKKNEFTPCNGWSKTAHEQKFMSFAETSRLIAHLIGHFLGLRHPVRSRCAILDGTSPLMCSPKKDVPAEFFERSRHVDAHEMTRARAVAVALARKAEQEKDELPAGSSGVGR